MKEDIRGRTKNQEAKMPRTKEKRQKKTNKEKEYKENPKG